MDCAYFTEQISAWLDGELSEAARAELSAHLAECAACRALADELFVLRLSFDAPQVSAPDTLIPAVLRQLRPKRSAAPWRRLGAMAAMFAVVLTGAWAMRSWIPDAPPAAPIEGQTAPEQSGQKQAKHHPGGGAEDATGDTVENAAEMKVMLTGEAVDDPDARVEVAYMGIESTAEDGDAGGATTASQTEVYKVTTATGADEPVSDAPLPAPAAASDRRAQVDPATTSGGEGGAEPFAAAAFSVEEEGDASAASDGFLFFSGEDTSPEPAPDGDVVVLAEPFAAEAPPAMGRLFVAVTLSRAEAEAVLRAWLGGGGDDALVYLGTLAEGEFYCFESPESGAVYAVSTDGRVAERGTPEGDALVANWTPTP